MQFTNSKISSLVALALFCSACSKSDNNGPERESSDIEFFIAATSGEGSYLLAVPDVSEGETTIVGQGLETDSYTAWVFPNQHTGIGLKYQKGDPGLGIGVGLGASGNIVRKGSDFQIISRFTTYGPFQNKVLTIVQGIQTDDKDNLFSTFNFIDPDKNNAVSTVTRSTTNLTGNGEYATLSGVVPFGSGEFLSAIVPSKLVRNEEGNLTTATTAYPDSVWIAAFDADLNVKRIYGDDRLGYASGRHRSQYYSTISDDGKDNVYVFSPANEAGSTKPAGAIRIKSGEAGFDQSYFFDLGTHSGDISFQRVYHIADDWFALAYVRPGSTAPEGPAQPNALALVNVGDQSFQWINGLPDYNKNPSFGLPISENGKLYIPVSEVDNSPAIYIIDPVSGSASKGLTIHADQVSAIGKLAK